VVCGGLRAALAARRRLPGLPVLVLSQYVEEAYAAELPAGGASGIGYLLKDRVGRVEEFLDALGRVAAGGTALDPEVVTERSVSKHIGNIFLKLGLPPTDSGHRRVLAVLAHLNNP
jgi:hypothetical protein